MANFLFHFVMVCLLFVTTLCATTISGVGASLRSKYTRNMATQFEAIYQFGDSLNDNGNFIREPLGVRSSYNRFPYGQTINQPTGRASDGLLIVDYIAMYFHLPLLSPYLARGSDFTHGANFAVVGATATGGVRDNSLARQLTWFKYHLKSTFYSPKAIKKRLQNSLVIMGEIGGNDFNGPFSQGKSIQEVSQLVPKVVYTIKNAIEEVIYLGATNIVVPGNFPIGCVPLYLVLFQTNDPSKYDGLQCLKDYNAFSMFYNKKLIQAIKQLQQNYPYVAIVYADYYSALTFLISHAPRLGIEQDDARKACCGSGNNPYNYDLHNGRCGSPTAPVCEDPSKRVNWDGVHMTQRGNKCVAAYILKQFVPVLQKHLRKRT